MDFIQRLIHYFAVVRRQMRRHRRMVITCAAVVVFATTYALILPAITLDEDTANETPGVSIEQPATEGEKDAEATDATVSKEPAVTADEATSTDSDATAGDSVTAEEPEATTDSAAESTATQEPAVLAGGTTLTATKDDDYTVTATVKDGSGLHEGTTLNVEEITDSDADYQRYRDAALAQLKAESDDPDSLELQSIRLFDISFRDGEEQDAEPASPVDVDIQLANPTSVEDASNVKVVHIDDKANDAASVVDDDKTEVEAPDDQLSKVSFQADSFSVYAITETSDTNKTKEYRRTYTFQNDDGSAYTFNLKNNPNKDADAGNVSTSEQIVKNGDALLEVGTPTPKLDSDNDGTPDSAGKEFLGWGVVTKNADGTETVDMGNLITLPQTVGAEGSKLGSIGNSDETVILRAVFSDAVTLTFYDYDGTVIYQERVAKDSTVNLSNYTATAQVEAKDSEHMVRSFVGWSTTRDGTTAMSNSYAAAADTDIYPVYKEGYWLYFVANDADRDPTAATFTDSKFVEGADLYKVTSPTPTRAGYTFDGWYTNAKCTDENRFDFTGTLSGNTTLYAKWTPAITNYTVVFWLQDANDDSYSYAGQVTKQGTSAQTTSYSVSMADLPESISTIANYLSLNTGDHAIEQQFIKGDGSTIVNVYYDRKTYTLRFYYAYRNGNNYGVDIETSPFSNAAQGSSDSTALSAQTAHQNVNNGLPTLNSQYTTTGTTTAGSYTYYYFDISARYGQEISSIWPNQPFGDYSTGVTSGSSTLHFVSWASRNGSDYYSSHNNKNIKGPYSTLDSSLIIDPDATVAMSFLAYWNYPTTYTYSVYYSLLDGETADIIYEGVGYKLHQTYSVGSTAVWQGQNALTFEGVTSVGHSETYTSENKSVTNNDAPVGHSGQGNNNKGGTVQFAYNRNLHSITFNANNGSTTTWVDSNIPYGEDISNTNVVDQRTTDAQGAAPEHYTFVGWSTDPNATADSTLFQFTGTMPDNDIVLYAVYKANDHTVTFDPNGGTIPGQTASSSYSVTVLDQGSVSDTTQATVLRTTRTSDDTSVTYTLVGWYRQNSDGTETLYNFGDTVTQDITLKAHWRQSGQYYVRYVDSTTDGSLSNKEFDDIASYADQSDVQVQGYPSTWTLPNGKVFAGWQLTMTDSDGASTTKQYAPGETFTMDANRTTEISDKKYMTLTAVYTELGTTYLTYDANGGEGTLTDPTGLTGNTQVNIEPNSSVTLSNGTGFTRSGYVLVGWNSNQTKATNGEIEWNLGETVGVNGDDGNTLYAVWHKPIDVKKVSNDATQTPLSKAKFKLTKLSGDTYVKVTSADFYGTVSVDSDGFTTSATGANGLADLNALKDGSYRLTETEAPDGYVISTSNYDFTVTDGKVALGKGTSGASVAEDGSTITITNTPGEALPNTGGSGSLPFLLGGSALITTAIVGFALRRRNEGRGV